MRRSLSAFVAGCMVAGAGIGISAALTSASPRVSSTSVAASSPAPMPMPMPATAGAPQGAPKMELHRRVVHVTIQNFAFVPARVVVSPGTRVVWTNEDSDPHTVTSDAPGGGLSSQALDTGTHFQALESRSGTVTYHCTIHPFMHGAVTVQA